MNDAISERDVVIPAKAPPGLRQVRSVASAARGQGPGVRRLPPVQSQGQALWTPLRVAGPCGPSRDPRA
jgi:hypothetical protein